MMFMSCSALMGKVLADSGCESEERIAQVQRAASECRGMQLYVLDCETDAEYTLTLTEEEAEELQQQICRMQPGPSDDVGDVDPTEIVEVNFLNAEGQCIGVIDADFVVYEGHPDTDNYSNAFFVLSKQDYKKWRHLIHQAKQRIKP